MADGRHLEKLKNGHISASVRFRAMTLSPLHLVVNWRVFTIYVIIINRQQCAQRKTPVIQFTQRPILRFFAPQAHDAPMGWNLSRSRDRKSPPPCQISPHQCNDKGIGPPKLNHLRIFDQHVEYKGPARAYPLRNFHKICRICTSFQDTLAVNVLLDLLKGLWSYGGLIWRGLVTPKFSVPPSGEIMRQTLKRFRGTRTC